MDLYAAIVVAIVGSLFLIKSSTANIQLIVTSVTDDVKNSREGEVDHFLLMNELATHFTSKCLRLMILAENMDIPRKYWSSGAIIEHSKSMRNSEGTTMSDSHILISATPIHQAQKVLKVIKEKMEIITSFSCVTYIITHHPDSRLIASLTTSSSNMQLARYFLIHTQNVIDAKNLLLDPGLAEEENVAAVTRQEFHNKTFWSVLTRQLLHPSGSPRVLRANTWSPDTGLLNTEDIFPEQMGNFYGKRLIGTTMQFKPFIIYEKVEGTRVVRPKPSLDVHILDVIAHKLNFTYDLVLPEDGLWGFLMENGHWAGVVGDVEFRRANFSMCLSLTLERLQSVDFTRMYFRDPMTFVTAKSRPSSLWLKLVTPFNTGVWVLVLCSVVGAVLLYHVIHRAQTALSSSRSVSFRTFMQIFGSFLGQSLDRIPWLLTGRVFLGSWLLYSILVTTYYKTSLTSTLAVPFKPPTINTLQQLVRTNLKVAMNKAMGSPYQLFSTSDSPLYQEIFRNLNFYSWSKVMQLVAEGGHALINFRSALDFIVSTQYTDTNGETNLHVALDEFFPGGYAWAFPKGSPYRQAFDAVMWRCVQGGLISKWLKDIHSIYMKEFKEERSSLIRENTLANTDDDQVVLRLSHFQGPFFIFFIGSGGGVLLLILELLAARF